MIKPAQVRDVVALLCLTLTLSCGETITEAPSNPNDRELLNAARCGDASDIQEALRAGANPDSSEVYINQAEAETGNRRYALELAARSGNVEALRALLQGGADPKGEGARSALGVAAFRGDHDMLTILLDGGVPPRPAILNAASMGGHTETLKFLLARGVPADNKMTQETLLYAVREHRTEHVKILLDAGVPVADEYGSHILQEAKQSQFSDIVELLRKAGATDKPAGGTDPD